MTKRRFCFTFFLLICFSLPLTATAQTVDIPDPNLRALLADALGKTSGEAITRADMARFLELPIPNANIRDLTGLEHATNLTKLNLGPVREGAFVRQSNILSDISPIAGLTNLEELNLEFTFLSDISPLEGLNNLTKLYLGGNVISDISPLEGLNSLMYLGLENTFLSDISPLEGLNNLLFLTLHENSISDISSLTGLNNLAFLWLHNNAISDISSLTGLNNLAFLWLHNNAISDISSLTGLNNLTWLFLSGNSITDISPLVANTGLGREDIVDVTDNPLSAASINTHIPTLQSRGVDVRFDAVIAEPVDIPDPNLRAAIERTLGKAPGSTITESDMANLTRLVALNDNISDLTGLEHATNLTFLRLGPERPGEPNSNSITDISAVGQLTELTFLDLDGNAITDIATVSGLTNLTVLGLRDNSITDISPVAGLTNLTTLGLSGNSISDISAVSGLTNLTRLWLANNSISDLSPLVTNTGLGSGDRVWLEGNPLSTASINSHIPALQRRGVEVQFDAVVVEPVAIPDPNLRAAIENELGLASGATITTAHMANLTRLEARNANISDLTGLEAATSLAVLNLGSNSISDISPVADLTNLLELYLWNNSISDISPVAGLTNLTRLSLQANSISDISPVAGLTNLTFLSLRYNSISDISAVAGLTNLTRLALDINSISDISPLAGLTNLMGLFLQENSISDISAVAGLTNLTELALHENSISDISPLVANTGLGTGDFVDVSENPLNSASITRHIRALQSRGVEVHAYNLKPSTSEYTLRMPAGISLIHIPLRVTEVNGAAQTIGLISDLYDALGGVGVVNFLITYDTISQEWYSYFVPSDKGGPADSGLGDDMGIIVGLRASVSLDLSGNPLGTDGSSAINLHQGLNVVGLPLDDSRINRVSDLLKLDGIEGNVPVIILTDGGEFKLVGRAGDPGDIEITGGQAFIMTASRTATVDITGDAWANGSGTAAAPSVTLKGVEVRDTTPVLGLRGVIVDEGTGLNKRGFRVTVKNLSTGKAVAAVTASDEAGYQLTVVDIEKGQAATVGDVLEISAQSRNPFIGVKPLRYTVTAEDVKQSLTQLPELVAYKIPAETELLSNYPNPFNPETWIPYRLAEEAFVTLTIYDLNGQIVRTIDVGHQTAAVYENRSKAIYWDGRNNVGEPVASGAYFYHLSAGDYSATRKMIILK